MNNTRDLFFPFGHLSLLVIYPRGEREGLFFVRQIKVGEKFVDIELYNNGNELCSHF